MEQKKKNSNARIKANNKYSAKTYKNICVHFKIAEAERIEEYCKLNNISKNKFIIECVMDKLNKTEV